MKRVSVVAVQEGEDFLWTVHEAATDSVVGTFYFEDEAKDYAKLIENGGVFAGFTPAFMVANMKMSVDKIFKIKVV
jgi:hypothetical protein